MMLAFAYAQRQFLGLEFEPFRLTTEGVTYAWSAPAWPLRLLLRLGLTDLAFRLFVALAEVS